MKIAVDAMGGDHAPDEIVRGALLYREKGGPSDLVLVGREDPIRKLLGAEIPPSTTSFNLRAWRLASWRRSTASIGRPLALSTSARSPKRAGGCSWPRTRSSKAQRT